MKFHSNRFCWILLKDANKSKDLKATTFLIVTNKSSVISKATLSILENVIIFGFIPLNILLDYSISEVLQSSMFKGYRVSNLLRSTRVCQNCQFIYEKIDGYRVEVTNQPLDCFTHSFPFF